MLFQMYAAEKSYTTPNVAITNHIYPVMQDLD